MKESKVMFRDQMNTLTNDHAAQLKKWKHKLAQAVEENVRLSNKLEKKCQKAINAVSFTCANDSPNISFLSHWKPHCRDEPTQNHMSISSMVSHYVVNNNLCDDFALMQAALEKLLKSFARLEEKFSDHG